MDAKEECEVKELLNETNENARENNGKPIENLSKLDEFSSLEREIAEMHHVDPKAPVIAQRVKDDFHGDENRSQDDKFILEMHPRASSIIPTKVESETINNDDLIAVLKGFDHHEDEPQTSRAPSATSSLLAEGVTIEGEGQYAIMDVVDDEGSLGAHDNDVKEEPKASATPKTSSHLKKKLTPEQERVVAMEQIANISGAESRRKQVLKIKKDQEPINLVSALGADWSDDEFMPVKKENKAASNKLSTVITEAIQDNEVGSSQKGITSNSDKPEIRSVVIINAANDPPIKSAEVGTKESSEGTGGRNVKRVIKRKIIWDPDAPETQFSYAQLIRKTSSPKPKTSPNLINQIKKESQTKKSRPASTAPKEKKSIINDVPLVDITKAEPPIGATKANKKPVPNVSEAPVELDRRPTVASRRSQTPVSNGAGGKRKKVTEIDRLMSDEGAINMLNSLEQDRTNDQADDKMHKMRSRAVQSAEKIVKREPQKKESPATKGKRAPKSKASDSWDYVYQQQTSDDAMIIRRRSNSSYSSNASLPRLSLDAPIPQKIQSSASETTKSTTTSENSDTNQTKNDAFEFAKPESKSNQKMRRGRIPPANSNRILTTDIKKAQERSPNSTNQNEQNDIELNENSSSPTPAKSDVIVRKMSNVFQISFSTHKSRIGNTFTLHMLNNLVKVLNRLKEKKDCHVVVLTTSNEHFCQGIDVTDLAIGPVQARKTAALELANAVKNYLKTLATYPKPLIAGINGHNVNLGVTQLALFDIVVGSDNLSFETPYAKIGQTPEGLCFWNENFDIQNVFKKKLLWLNDKVHAEEIATMGLLYKLCPPEKLEQETLAVAQKIVKMSTVTYQAMKKAAIEKHENISDVLDQEFQAISEQWTSPICFEKFKKYLTDKHF